MADKTLGQKIRDFRTQAGFSQFELELQAQLAAGSLSRIEKDKTNPTKETLLLIGKALELKPFEMVELFSIPMYSPQDLILSLNSLYSTLDLDTILQAGVDLMIDLFPHSIGGVIFLKDEVSEDLVFSKTLTSSAKLTYTARVLDLLPRKFNKLSVSLTKDIDNLIVKTIKDNRNFESTNLADFIKGPVPGPIITQLKYITGFRRGLSMPIVSDSIPIGAAFYSRNVERQFSRYEIELLRLMTDQFANAIRNAQEYEKLKKHLTTLNHNE